MKSCLDLTYFFKQQGRQPRWKSDLIIHSENNRKFKEIIGKLKASRGEGYRQLSEQPIVIPPNINDQLKKVMISLASLRAGNNNPDLLKEMSANLDELYKNKVISKQIYKVLYYKAKNLLHLNSDKKESA